MKTLHSNGVLLIVIAVIAFAGGCDVEKPVEIGFSGQLTGPHAVMGVSGRDGVLLAIDEINASGGIAGRNVKLVVRDDRGTAEGARVADQELIDAGVVAIIGHMTSSQSMAALPVTEKAGMVMISPTTSTPALTGRVDHFFRVVSGSTSDARFLARHLDKIGLERVAAIHDQDNTAYTNAYLNAFREELQKTGGRLVGEAGYSSTEKPVFGPIVARLRDEGPQCLLILTSAFDGAHIAQQTRILGWRTNLFGCGWTLSAPLIENGGKAVEGMGFFSDYDWNSQARAFLKFQRNYQARFKQAANFMASDAYEAMLVLAAALEKTGGQQRGLTRVLPGIQISGLKETVSLDRYGDSVRAHYLIVVENGRFVTKERLEQ